MNIRSIICICLVVFAVGCVSQPDKVKPTVSSLVGNYVSEDYGKRSEGYDWVAVLVSQISDSTVKIAVRSRADLKKPTCRFDAEAVLVGVDTLKSFYDGRAILFVLKGDKLSISAENQKDDNLLCYFCSGGASLAGDYKKIAEPLDNNQIDKVAFEKVLSSGAIVFTVSSTDSVLTIRPIGLEVVNDEMKHSIDGYTVVNAEIGDLNIDGYPELMVYLNSVDSCRYGMVISYSVNNGKSMSQIYFPSVLENDAAKTGYQGHDEFAIVESSFDQRFPIFEGGNRTEKMRQIQYKLKDGEACRQLVVDKIIEY